MISRIQLNLEKAMSEGSSQKPLATRKLASKSP